MPPEFLQRSGTFLPMYFQITHPIHLHLASEHPVDANRVRNHNRHTDARDDELYRTLRMSPAMAAGVRIGFGVLRTWLLSGSLTNGGRKERRSSLRNDTK